MKQYIAKEQFGELSIEEKHIFYDLWWDYENQKWREVEGLDCDFVMDRCEPNIGQMIEFLGDDLKNTINFQCSWEVILNNLPTDNSFNDEKLCDALWEAVKYKIRKQ